MQLFDRNFLGGVFGNRLPATGTEKDAAIWARVPPQGSSQWQSAVDPESGNTYYYNPDTSETSWELPLELPPQPVPVYAPPPVKNPLSFSFDTSDKARRHPDVVCYDYSQAGATLPVRCSTAALCACSPSLAPYRQVPMGGGRAEPRED